MLAAAARKLGIDPGGVKNIKVIGEAIDARRKPNIQKVYSVAVEVTDNIKDAEIYTPARRLISELGLSPKRTDKRVYVAGSGPAGLFCALTLSRLGVKCVVLERGFDVDNRDIAVNELKVKGVLNPSCNIQFGEGGAGTYSDGKLNTGTHDSLISIVLGELADHGAPPEIERLSKPHIGADYLKKVVKNIRNDIIDSGSEFRFGTTLEDIEVKFGKLSALKLKGKIGYSEDCRILALAVGHSARDTFEMLKRHGAALEPKPFSMGVRIEHPQRVINLAQYGTDDTALPPADYKLSHKLEDGRGVYTFCMCPGGEVVYAASEEGMLSTNGMSEFARDKKNANSAVLVSVTPADFGGGDALAGIEYQRKYERLAYLAGGGGYKAPAQRLADFIKGKVSGFGKVLPSYMPGVTPSDLNACLPGYVSGGIKAGIAAFGRKLRGFDDGDSLLTGVETRSSSPVRILRDENHCSSIEGLYPCGEGSGYSGGIVSSAVDGIKTALKIYENL